ncbi:DNA polymerase III subunit delta [Oceanibium sediminis]|uniref:DNA polymerase III subunit delta n=1 Tax=Oceanibium sediminis TaxID=2026339 RepID=UPI000DD3CBA4|nr:DNA polymerase III subunit delta [Oceanibium sediminis]
MKLGGREQARFLATPDLSAAGVLFYGPDAMRTALKRQDLIATIIGPKGEAEMRLTRLSGSDLRGDPAALTDALKAVGFFPGPRAVLLEEAGDGTAPAVKAALEDWAPGDAFLVVTAGQLTPRSPLRKLFEGAKNAYAAPIYTDPPGREEIEAALKRAGLTQVSQPALTDLYALAQTLDPGDLRQTMEKLALYKLSEDTPVDSDDVAAVAPMLGDANLDDVINHAADGATEALCAALPRLAAQGTTPVSICIALNRYFRQLHAAAAHPQGPEQALTRARPPVFGPRRDKMVRQARHWGSRRLENVLRQIMDTDLALRSARPVPAAALVERLMMRIAIEHRRG